MHARYSPIAPITLLEELLKAEIKVKVGNSILGNYLLLLSHDVLKHPERYEELVLEVRYRYDSKKGLSHQETFIIMDNSVVELGKAMDFDDVVEAACVVEADCIMTPDVLGSAAETQDLCTKYMSQLRSSCGFPLMRVPQGKDNAELVQCVDWIRQNLPADEGKPEYWGVPRWITNKIGSRIPITQYITMTGENVHTHLLGMSQNYVDDCRCAKLDDVMGIDSANPLVMGYMHLPVRKKWIHMDRGNYWDIKHIDLLALANMDAVRSDIRFFA